MPADRESLRGPGTQTITTPLLRAFHYLGFRELEGGGMVRLAAVLHSTISRPRIPSRDSPDPRTLLTTALCLTWLLRAAFFSWPSERGAVFQCRSIVSCHPCGRGPRARVLWLARRELRPARFLPYQPPKSARQGKARLLIDTLTSTTQCDSVRYRLSRKRPRCPQPALGRYSGFGNRPAACLIGIGSDQ